MMSLVVIICTHNRSRLLDKILQSLNAARRPGDLEIRVLVVANRCTDDTLLVLDKYTREGIGDLLLSWVEEPQLGKSHALNTALQMIDTDFVAFVDDDHRVESGYFESIYHAFNAYPHAGLLCGRILPDWDGTEPAWVHDHGPYRIYPLPVPRFDLGDQICELSAQRPIPGGGNLVMRAEVLRRVGEFNSDLGPRGRGLEGSEDTDYVLRALGLGVRGVYLPGLYQYHHVDRARLKFRYILRKSYQRSRSVTRARSACLQVPAFMWRKVAVYTAKAGLSLSWMRTRFYLVRLMAVLGEMRGIRDNATARQHN
jgi:glycosyltransferase involved in cell wall biosynthesis